MQVDDPDAAALTQREQVTAISGQEYLDPLALVAAARAGATPADIHGTAWGKVLSNVDPEILAVSGDPTIAIPDGIPDVS